MLIGNISYHSIWLNDVDKKIKLIDQTKLPHEFKIYEIKDLEDAVHAIKKMLVRGAPLIGVTAAFGFAVAMNQDSSESGINKAYSSLVAARPTAINLEWACCRMRDCLRSLPQNLRTDAAYDFAQIMAKEDIETNTRIGKFGAEIIKEIAKNKVDESPVRILTHCNAGWLATVDRGTATSPIYEANEQGISLEVWVDETRPRNQGAALTAWELQHNNISNTLIVDNAGGHLMQRGLVDLVIVGSDRTTANGDVCNKIGTYLKALAAYDNNVPFYAALPISTIDFSMDSGSQIPIEERDVNEVLKISGITSKGRIDQVDITVEGIKAKNPAFDVTPAKFVTALITDKGIIEPNRKSVLSVKPD